MVHGVALSGDEWHVVSASEASTLKVWDLEIDVLIATSPAIPLLFAVRSLPMINSSVAMPAAASTSYISKSRDATTKRRELYHAVNCQWNGVSGLHGWAGRCLKMGFGRYEARTARALLAQNTSSFL